MELRPAAARQQFDLFIYGDIGDNPFAESITAKDVADKLATLGADVTQINVRINSFGGSVADGLAIYNGLKRHTARKVVTVDGVAMSAASLIAMAGDRVEMPATSMLMIHAPWALAGGNAAALRKHAASLDKYSEAMLNAYVSKSGKSTDEIRSLLTDGEDHFFTGEEAVAAGFADILIDDSGHAAAEDAEALEFARAMLSRFGERLGDRATLAYAAASRSFIASSQTKDNSMPKPIAPGEISDEQHRRDQIRMMFSSAFDSRSLNHQVLLQKRDEFIDNPRATPEEAGQWVLRMMAQDREPLGAAGYVHSDEAKPRRDLVEAAGDVLSIRAGIQVDKPHPGVREVQGMGMREIMEACVSRSGSRDFGFGNGGRGLVRAALSTSDFPMILENSLGKALRAGFESEPGTFRAWTRKVTVPDFKPQSRVILGSAPELEHVPELGEYKYGSLDEDKSVPYQVEKFGRLVKLSWETLVNDDLGAFLRLTQAMGQAAARCEADRIYAQFAENSGAGPTMQDGQPLFHASHGNLVDQQTGITAAALGAARVKLRRQTALGGGALNLPPRYLLIAPEHEQDAEVLLAAAARSMNQGEANALQPSWIARLELVVEPRLTTDAFYVLTSPNSIDTVERAYLEEHDGAQIKQEESFIEDAQSYRIKHVFASRWLDWRGAVKVPLA